MIMSKVRKNIVGNRYGRLVVTEELGHGYVMCHCDCGNDKKIRKWQIMQGGIHSCGCLRREIVPTHGDIKSLSKDGTNLSILASKKTRSSNTSGVRGVHWDKSRCKWIGGVKIKGVDKKKRFDTLKEATEYRKMLEELYSNAYVYVLPSDVEGMPLSLLEAMSYGNCCLVSDIKEITEVVEDKAVIFPKGNVNLLTKKLQFLCDNKSEVAQYKAQATEFICGKYNWNSVVNETVSLYY